MPTIDIASVTSTDVLNDATVQNVGTPSNVALAFTIPRQSRANVQSMVENSITQHGLQTAAQVDQRIADAIPSVHDGAPGQDGTDGQDGANGQSAYQLWLAQGHTGSIDDFLAALKGQPGQDGASVKGDKGDAATVAVGTTTTLAAGQSATVQNVGTTKAAVLNFGIPRGANGNDGAAATVAIGTVTTGSAGSQASVTNAGTANAAVLNFGIPRGANGLDGKTPTNAELTALITPLIPSPIAGKSAYQEWLDQGNNGSVAAFMASLKGAPGAPGTSVKGDKGDKGDAATIAVGTVTTGAAGGQASVTNSGTSSAAVLDFTIPRGANGTAASIAVGTITTLAANAAATVQNAGTSSAAVLNFGIPQGIQGVPGTTDHSQLTNLTTGDPHTQYLNQARGDARYGQLAASNTWTADQRFTGAAGGGNNGVVGIVVLYGGKVLPVKASSKGLLGLLGSNTRILFVDDV